MPAEPAACAAPKHTLFILNKTSKYSFSSDGRERQHTAFPGHTLFYWLQKKASENRFSEAFLGRYGNRGAERLAAFQPASSRALFA